MSAAECKLSCTNDAELLERLSYALSGERRYLVEFIRLLGEMYLRGTHLRMGYRSANELCVVRFGLSENQAHRRAACARVALHHPRVLDLLATGEQHMTNIALLAKHLTADNFDEVMAATSRRTKHEVEHYIAERFGDGDDDPKHRPDSIRAAGHGTYEVRLTIDADTKALLDRAQALKPEAGLGEVFGHALEGFVDGLERAKFKTTNRPRSAPPPEAAAGHRPIAAAVKRAVYRRDGGRCTYESKDGRRCTANAHLEFDHLEPIGRGGRSTEDNVRLLCRNHNQLEAKRVFGATHIDAKRDERRRASFSWEKTTAPPDAVAALRSLDFSAALVHRLVRHVRPTMKPNATDEQWIRAALQAYRQGAAPPT